MSLVDLAQGRSTIQSRIVAQRRGLGSVRVHPFEPADLPIDFFGGFFGHLRRADLLSILFDFLLKFVALAKFLLDRLHLLPQVVFTLGTVDFSPGLRVDVVLNLQNLDLLGQHLVGRSVGVRPGP